METWNIDNIANLYRNEGGIEDDFGNTARDILLFKKLLAEKSRAESTEIDLYNLIKDAHIFDVTELPDRNRNPRNIYRVTDCNNNVSYYIWSPANETWFKICNENDLGDLAKKDKVSREDFTDGERPVYPGDNISVLNNDVPYSSVPYVDDLVGRLNGKVEAIKESLIQEDRYLQEEIDALKQEDIHLQEEIDALATDLSEKVNQLQQKDTELQTEIINNYTDLSEKIEQSSADLTEYIDEQITNVNNNIDDLRTYIDAQDTEIKADLTNYIDTQDNNIKNYVDMGDSVLLQELINFWENRVDVVGTEMVFSLDLPNNKSQQ